MVKKQSRGTKIATATLMAIAPLSATANNIEVSLDNPSKDFNTRANLSYSANQISDKLINESPLSNNIYGRAIGEGINAAVGYGTAFWAHETAHNPDVKFKFDGITPQVSQDNLSGLSPKQLTQYFQNGLNQNTFTADKMYEESILNNKAPGVAFLFHSLYLAGYNPRNVRTSGKTINDLDGWRDSLADQGINAPSNDKIKNLTALCALASAPNWQAIQNITNHITNGEEGQTPYLNINPLNLEVAAPMFSAYLTDQGKVFINGKIFTKGYEDDIQSFEIGKAGSTTRVGLKAYDLETPFNNVTASPSAYINSNGGYMAGVDLNVKTGKTSSLKFALEQSSNDLMSKVKGENGFNARASYMHKF